MPYCRKCGNELPEEAKYCPVCGTPVSTEETPVAPTLPPAPTAPEAPVAAGLTLASWGERFVAWLIDAILVTIAMGILTGIIGIIGLFSGFGFFNIQDWFPVFGLNGIVIFFYWTFMESSNGQSFGKMAMRIKVTRVNGSAINMGQAAIESIGKAFFPILVIDFLIGLILYPKKQQRLFNYLSQTIVVKIT
jgi:uncharacterized RDD family membrane protein YckC